MKRFVVTLMTAGMLAAAVNPAAFADEKIQDRKQEQQQRIGQGVQNGSLSPKETRNLERKEVGVNREIRHDRKVNGGNLTNNEKAKVNRQQNHLSNQIYKDKHN